MPREKWLVDPAELDEFQRGIRELSIEDSYIVKGCAGSGKTILALYRANDIRIEAIAKGETPSFTMVVYTKALQSFIRSGIRELGIGPRQVIYSDQWDGNQVDHLIIDEAQDFKKEDIDGFNAARIRSIMLYGDSQQQIYNDRLSTEEIAKQLGLVEKELFKNYRLPKLIASFAAHLGNDKDLEKKCVKTGTNKPRLKKFNSWQEELNYIIGEIRTRNYTDVAILLPFNDVPAAPYNNFHRNIQTVKEYYDSIGVSLEYKFNETMDLNFDSELPKVMTYHSSKGLQFETIFIPFCDFPGHDRWFVSKYRNPLYVALTRSYRNLYLTYSERLTPFFRGIPPTKYE
ncbi:3'-5' exonuclease [Pollutibacter soli]|uniref:3'-5' exonuclease n=1 Tax=Pollutibacter soli TaxID=3034157 RepID=UPI00301397EC